MKMTRFQGNDISSRRVGKPALRKSQSSNLKRFFAKAQNDMRNGVPSSIQWPWRRSRRDVASGLDAGARDNLQFCCIGKVIEVGAVTRYSNYQLGIFSRIAAGILEHLGVQDVQLHLHPT